MLMPIILLEGEVLDMAYLRVEGNIGLLRDSTVTSEQCCEQALHC